MTTFYICNLRNNARDMIIGHAVMSKSKSGGERVHFTQEGVQRADGTNPAYDACVAAAARLEAEAAANRARTA